MTEADQRPASGVDPQTGEWTSAFPGQRRPFQKGHTQSMLSGFTSERVVGPLAEKIAAKMTSNPHIPYLRHPLLAELVNQYARAEAREQLLLDLLDELFARFDDDGEPPAGMPVTRRFEAAQKAYHRAWTKRLAVGKKLGLGPLEQATAPPDALWRKAAAEYGGIEWDRPPLPPR